MAYIELVIKVDEDRYKATQRKVKNPKVMLNDVDVAISNGTVLPKGHGRLIDADKLKTHFIGTEQGTDLEVYLESTIINAQTIIEADKEG